MKSYHIFLSISIVTIISLLFAPVQAQNTSLPVGAIPGNADVTSMGAATYNIPIEVVPGTQGIQPDLSVMYNSMTNIGILGSKWDLCGLSAITRVGQNLFLDERSTSVTMNYSDRFSLDGNRLVCNNPLYYGSNGTLYQTEFEDFSKVYSYGTVGSGPEYFKVFREDGSVAEYGNSVDSKQRLGNSIYSWLVNKITDINGNYMTFTYGCQGGEIWIEHIDYTGNESAGLMPYARVFFSYDLQAHIGSTFVAGYEIPQTRLLRSVTVQYKNGANYETVRQYMFYYSDDLPKRLVSVKLRGSDGSELNPTTVEWTGTPYHDYVDTTLFSGLNLESTKHHVAIDFDKDGFCDMFVYDDHSRYYYQNINGDLSYNGFHDAVNPSWYIQKCVPADIDGDGFSELVTAVTDANKHMTYVTLTRYPFLTETFIPTFQTYGYKDIVTGDFLGNGHHQIVLLYKVSSDSYAIQFPSQNIVYPVSGGVVDVMDFDGDGRMELMVLDEVNYTTYSIYKYDESLHNFNMSSQGNLSDRFVTSGDFNGDGIADVIAGHTSSYSLCLGNGRGFVSKPLNEPFGLNNVSNSLSVVDINHDGLDDVVAFKKDYGTNGGLRVISYINSGYFNDTVYFNSNIGASFLPYILTIAELNDGYDFTFGDFNNDLHVDLIAFKMLDPLHDGVVLYEFMMEKRIPLVKKVTAGDNSYVQWQHQEIKGYYYCYASHIYTLPYFFNVVKTMHTSGDRPNRKYAYHYGFKTPQYNLVRLVFLGFSTISCSDSVMNASDTTHFMNTRTLNVQQDFLMPSQKITKVGGTVTQTVNYSPSIHHLADNRCFPYFASTIENDNLLSTSVIQRNIVNSDGRIVGTITETKDINETSYLTKDSVRYYYSTLDLSGNAFLTRTDSVVSYSFAEGASTFFSKKQMLTYYANGNLLSASTFCDGDTTTVTNNTYNAFGNVTSQTLSASGCENRSNMRIFDATGRFCITEFNAMNHVTSVINDPRTGLPLTTIDENILSTDYSYDAFGRPTAVRHPDGNTDTFVYGWYTDDEIPNAKYYSLTHVPGNSFDIERYYDLLGRNICIRENGYFTDIRYNTKGQVEKVSKPYVRGTADEDKIWTIYNYDNFGRVVSEQGPHVRLAYSYSGRTTTVTDQLRGTNKVSTVDAAGRPVAASDPGGQIQYGYAMTTIDGKKAIATTVNSNGNTSTIWSDQRGNRIRMTDPDAGTTSYDYNTYGEMVRQVDARKDTLNMCYDKLGRITQKQYVDSTGAAKMIHYYYDSFSNHNKGIGKLSRITIDGVNAEVFAYDTIGRPVHHIRYIDNVAYPESYTYNSYGQLATQTYPDNFITRFSYDEKGRLSLVDNGSYPNLIFHVESYNLYGQPLKCRFGNGTATEYEYNSSGLLTRINTGKMVGSTPVKPPLEPMSAMFLNTLNNVPDVIIDDEIYTVDSSIQNFHYTYDNKGRLVQRDQKNSQYETFQYDNLDRLVSFAQGTFNGVSQTFNTVYDAQGNILSNTLAGMYSYDSNKPHAVTKVTPTTNFPNAISADSCETDYNVFNQPSRIREGDVEILLKYGHDGQREKAVFKRNGVVERTRYYISANYEKEVDATGVTTHYNYVYGATGLAAICVRRTGVDSMYYVHPDRLGSYTHITNANKQVIRNLHFDPWGNVKSDTNWLTFDSTTLSGSLAGTFRFSRGFTGHEHYADLKIINMNGRLYDPVIARFFSPDNFVQAPEFTQSYNRYSYCLNNPLQYTDPSGEEMFAPWYRDFVGFVHRIGSVDDMPNYGTLLGDEGVFTSGDEMRYYYADGRVSNLKLPQVFIDWGNPADFTFSFSSFPMRGAGFYRIGDPSEQTGSFSSNFQYVAPIYPGYINGLNAYGVANGAKTNLIEAAVRYDYKSANSWWEFQHLRWKQQEFRKSRTLGKTGAKYLKTFERIGVGVAVASAVMETIDYRSYYKQYGFDWAVTTKFSLDMIMTGVAFLGPVGLTVSSVYFILDVTTDGFGGFGNMY